VSWQGHPAAGATRPRTAVTHPGISLGRRSAASAGPDAQPSWPGPPRSTPTPSCQHEAPPLCRSDCSDTLGRIASSSWEHMFAPMEHTALLSVATSPLTAKPSGRKSGSHPTHQGLASARAATPACADFRTPCATTGNGCDPQIGREQVVRGSSPSPGSASLASSNWPEGCPWGCLSPRRAWSTSPTTDVVGRIVRLREFHLGGRTCRIRQWALLKTSTETGPEKQTRN
jgi:hypothetical protein